MVEGQNAPAFVVEIEFPSSHLQVIIEAMVSSETQEERLARYRKALAGLRAPLAWVDLDLLEQNAREIVQRAGSKKIRLGTKSIRARAILDRLQKIIPQKNGLMTMTGREAVWLARLGYNDLIPGYPSVDREEIELVADAVREGHKIYLMADLAEHLDLYNAVATQKAMTLSVWLDLDASTPIPVLYFGVHRSSLQSAENVRRLITNAKTRWPNLNFDGLMSYEAQIAGVQDRPPAAWQGPIVRWLKRRSVSQIAQRRGAAVQSMREMGLPVANVNGGGTGSLRTTSRDSAVTEITVGSGFYSPFLFDFYNDFSFAPAAGFALEVTRHSHDKIWTCLGGGYPASGTGPDRAPRPYLPQGISLLPNEGTGEVQTPVQSSKLELRLGDLIFFRHAKAGELCERFNELHLIRGDKVEEICPTYRGEGLCFL